MPPELMTVGGPVAVLLTVIGGLVIALRTGALVPGSVLDRVEAFYKDSLARERALTDKWQQAHDLSSKAADTALETARMAVDQNRQLASGQELTERLIESLRRRVGS